MKKWTVKVNDDLMEEIVIEDIPSFDDAYKLALAFAIDKKVIGMYEDNKLIIVGEQPQEDKGMRVRLMARPALTEEFIDEHEYVGGTDGEIIALTAIRTCYSHLDPWEVYEKEGNKYFNTESKDGHGMEIDRLFRTITSSGHTSTMEHGSYTFVITGVSRALLAQLTRHRVGMSFSVQSQRYVRFGSSDRSGGFDYVVPPAIKDKGDMAEGMYHDMMQEVQNWYDALRALGVSAEDARSVLPNSASVNLVMSANLTSLITFYGKRRAGNGAQWEIADLAEQIRQAVVKYEPWTDKYFELAWHGKKESK